MPDDGVKVDLRASGVIYKPLSRTLAHAWCPRKQEFVSCMELRIGLQR